MSPPNQQKVPPENDTRPYDPKAKEECRWHSDGVEDRYGRYQFAKYPKVRPKIMQTVLEAIGQTPLVKLNKIPAEFGIECNVYGKCEFLNSGGSVKDRIALKMIELAEQSGRLRPGMTVIEPTSGNTGIGLALACAVKGYRCVIVMPAKMSHEKEVTLKALGAEIVRTKDDAPFDSEQSHVGMAFKLRRETPNSVVLDQYKNIANPMAHYESTAEEILDALDGKVDMVVVGVGTGGSVTGISRKIKKVLPQCKIIGVDPIGSVLGGDDKDVGHKYKVEGIGYDFVPSVLDMCDIDDWQKTGDPDTFQMARKMHLMEGILSGGSAGAILTGAMRAAKGLKKGQNCVFLLPDGVRNYLTKFVSNEWMLSNALMEAPLPEKRTLPENTFQKGEYDPSKHGEMDFQRIDKHSWRSVPFCPPTKAPIYDNIAGAIGNTPMVRLQRIPLEYGVGEAEILVKCEYFNAGGSVKDRMAKRMVEEAEKAGVLRPGGTIIEPTSGNTGICLAMMAAIRGYRCIIVMPEKMSREKEWVIRSLGAEVIRVPSDKDYLDPDCNFGVAYRLNKQIPGSVILQQFGNDANPAVHYEETAEEILYACDGKLDAMVIAAGTGGTLTGVAQKIRERVPGCKIIGVDPDGSILADPEKAKAHAYQMEGAGHDFVPATLDRSLVDEWITVTDADAFAVARQLIRKEGLLCGGSSGANVWAALEVAKRFGEAAKGKGKRIVTILPDSIRNYMSKFVDDEWMREKGFAANISDSKN